MNRLSLPFERSTAFIGSYLVANTPLFNGVRNRYSAAAPLPTHGHLRDHQRRCLAEVVNKTIRNRQPQVVALRLPCIRDPEWQMKRMSGSLRIIQPTRGSSRAVCFRNSVARSRTDCLHRGSRVRLVAAADRRSRTPVSRLPASHPGLSQRAARPQSGLRPLLAHACIGHAPLLGGLHTHLWQIYSPLSLQRPAGR